MRTVMGALAGAALLLAGPVAAQQKVPVQFAKGASSAIVKGTIKGDQYRDYIVNARAGQAMTVTLVNPDGRAYFNVMAPGSTGEAVFIGTTEGNSFRGPVPGTGANTVRVYQMRATARRGEAATYTLTIGIDASAAPGAAPAKTVNAAGQPAYGMGDAIDPATGYHATTSIPCGFDGQGPSGSCPAGVKRRWGEDGTHLVEVTKPDGRKRALYFRGTTAYGADSAQADGSAGFDFKVTRQGDETLIRFGPESYRVPDMLLTGG